MPLSTDAALAKDRLKCYRGIARVSLDSLSFKHGLVRKKHREISQQHVLHLVEVFERNGCLRLQDEHIIDAVVRDEDLNEALSREQISEENFRDVQWAQHAPVLDIHNVQCLSGMHRIEAAQRFLDDNDKWWIVRFYSDRTPKTTLTRLIESHVHEQKPSDGEVFRKIRLYHRDGDSASENRWWACLERSKPKDLRQLLKREEIVSAFDKLIDMPGLWAGIYIGALHRLLTLKCDEEMVNYLKYVARSWKAILRCDGRNLPPSAVDSQTVQRLENLAPSHSKIDKELICDLMERGILFPSQSDKVIRRALLSNICTFTGLIPSLRTFFGMLKYVEPTCEALRTLLDTRLKSTIRSSFTGLFWPPSQCSVQAAEHEDIGVETALSNEDRFMVAYAELWAFCSRYFDGLTASTPLKEVTALKPTAKGPNPVVWRLLARFATLKGFKIPNAQILLEDGEECYRKLALEYLHKAHPTRCSFDSQQIQRVILDGGAPSSNNSESCFLDTEYLSPERRIGRPFEEDFVKEKSILFLPRLFTIALSSEVTLTYVRRELFSCLFRDLKHLEWGNHSTNEPMDTSEDLDTDLDKGIVDHRVQEEVAKMQRVNAQLQQELLNERTTIAQLKQELSSSQNELGRTQQDLANVNSAFARLQSDHQTLKDRSQDLAKGKQKLQKQRDKLENRLGRRRGRLSPPLQPLAAQSASLTMLDIAEAESLSLLLPAPVSEPTGQLSESLDEPSNQLHPRKWEEWTGNYDEFELFVGAKVDSGCLVGCSFPIYKEASSGTRRVTEIVQQAKEAYQNVQLSAFTPRGKRIPNLDPGYLFSAFTHQRTIFLAPEDVTAEYISTISYSAAASTSGSKTMVLATNTAIGRRRRRSEENDDRPQIRAGAVGEYEVHFARNEDTMTVKKRILEMKKRTAVVTSDEHTSSTATVSSAAAPPASSLVASTNDVPETAEAPPRINLFNKQRVSNSSEEL